MRRKWLLYSVSTGLVVCYVCKLFSSWHVSLTIGFNAWENIHRLSEYEGSNRHKECISTLCVFGRQSERLDKSLAAHIQNDTFSHEQWKGTLLFCLQENEKQETRYATFLTTESNVTIVEIGKIRIDDFACLKTRKNHRSSRL